MKKILLIVSAIIALASCGTESSKPADVDTTAKVKVDTTVIDSTSGNVHAEPVKKDSIIKK